MRFIIKVAALLSVAAPASATDSVFARLVKASTKSDQALLRTVLSSETLSTTTGRVVEGNRVNGGPIRHGVPGNELAAKLVGCAVKQWRDVDSEQGSAYILWECPSRLASENDCYFYSYRAEMLDPRYHPANLLIAEMPSWDSRCGVRFVAPPKL
jgi:hypothetical protein